MLLDLAFLIPAFPLLGFLVILVAGRRLGEPGAGWVATMAMGGSFAAAAAEPADVPGGWRMPLPSHGVARASPMSSLYGMPK